MKNDYNPQYRNCKIKTQRASRNRGIEGEIMFPDGSYGYVASQHTKLMVFRISRRIIDDWHDKSHLWADWIKSKQLISALERASTGRIVVDYETR